MRTEPKVGAGFMRVRTVRRMGPQLRVRTEDTDHSTRWEENTKGGSTNQSKN